MHCHLVLAHPLNSRELALWTNCTAQSTEFGAQSIEFAEQAVAYFYKINYYFIAVNSLIKNKKMFILLQFKKKY